MRSNLRRILNSLGGGGGGGGGNGVVVGGEEEGDHGHNDNNMSNDAAVVTRNNNNDDNNNNNNNKNAGGNGIKTYHPKKKKLAGSRHYSSISSNSSHCTRTTIGTDNSSVVSSRSDNRTIITNSNRGSHHGGDDCTISSTFSSLAGFVSSNEDFDYKLNNNNSENNDNNNDSNSRVGTIGIGSGSSSSNSSISKPGSNSGIVVGDVSKVDDNDDVDPYADVRERMEALVAMDNPLVRATRKTAAKNQQQHEQHEPTRTVSASTEPKIPSLIAYTVYLSYALLIFVGHIRDMCAWIFQRGRFLRNNNSKKRRAGGGSRRRRKRQDEGKQQPRNDEDCTSYPSDDITQFAPLLKSWEHFYTRRLYSRIQDCFNRPIASNPGANIQVVERVSDDGQKSMRVLGPPSNLDDDQQRLSYASGKYYVELHDGTIARSCLNLGSYNYLGFADDWIETCSIGVKGSLLDLPISVSSSRNEYGTTVLHRQVENTVSRFLNKDDTFCYNMGFNTNATTIPALVGRGDLIISDELNHTSIVNGARASGAAIRIFRHNDVAHLEEILRETIILGRPRTRRPWNKILVIVEGIYSMEGEYCDLANVVRITKQYGAYLYLDEAHSIGALGQTGRGCTEYCGVDTADVDIMMGTFTKSFGGMGGYISASRHIIQHLKKQCSASSYHNSLSPVVCQQILTSFQIIMGEDGTSIGKSKLQSLRDNSNYFRMRLQYDIGLEVMGKYDSPIIPVMLYNPAKIAAFSRECLKRGLAVVVVGFPAVSLLMSRARFCISAAHTREDLDRAITDINEIANILNLKYASSAKKK